MKINILNRWKKTWMDRDLAYRMRELAVQAVWYLVITLLDIAGAGALAVYMLPFEVAQAGISFLAVVYLLLLLWATAHSFDHNHERYLLEQNEDILDELRDFKTKEGCK